MKTSQSQFEMLVTYMELHGDLSKLSTSNARSRIRQIRNWEELTELLNSDGAGTSKTTEKWKKAWSDFKNNTKRKAARLHQSASSGPAVFAKCTDLEQRVLKLMGLQVATGLAVKEAGLSQEVHIQPSPNNDDEQGIQTLYQSAEEYSQNVNQVETNIASAHSPPPPSPLRAISSPPLMFIKQEVESSQPNWHDPGPSISSVAPAYSPPQARPTTTASHITLVEAQVEEPDSLAPTRPSSQVPDEHVLAASVQTTPHCTRRTRGSTRRRGRLAHTEQAAQHLLQTDSFWRNFKEQQHRDNMELRREQNRIREMELQTQRDWQAIGRRVVNVLEKLANKYCKD